MWIVEMTRRADTVIVYTDPVQVIKVCEVNLNEMSDVVITDLAEIERLKIKLRDSMNIMVKDIQTVSQNRKTVDVSPHATGKVFLEISYVVYGASWRTYYELRANPVESPAGSKIDGLF